MGHFVPDKQRPYPEYSQVHLVCVMVLLRVCMCERGRCVHPSVLVCVYFHHRCLYTVGAADWVRQIPLLPAACLPLLPEVHLPHSCHLSSGLTHGGPGNTHIHTTVLLNTTHMQ